jgi:hypothetical protein
MERLHGVESQTAPLDSQIAAQNIFERQTEHGSDTRYTRPSPHYEGLYLWDSFFAAWINAVAGRQAAEKGLPSARRWLTAAQTELMVITDGQNSNGFIPNIQNFERKIDLERLIAFGRGSKQSNYTQPPVFALPILETHEAALAAAELSGDPTLFEESKAWLQTIYPKAKAFYKYFENFLSNDADDKLIGLYHPHMSGRDSDPTFDRRLKRWRLKYNGAETKEWRYLANIAIDYASILKHGWNLRQAGGDVQKMREVYWMNDVMMNCLYVDNLFYMAEIASQTGHNQDAEDFTGLALDVEQQVLTRMWDEKDKRFYALDSEGQHIKEMTVSNLFPLLLPNLREEQLEALLDTLDVSFNTPYPLPSVATDSRNYDPSNREKDRLWRGGVWINTNKLVEHGLRKQLARFHSEMLHRPDLMNRCQAWAERIDKRSRLLVKTKGRWEHYNPENANPLRQRVKKFAWSNLALIPILTAADRFRQQKQLQWDYEEIDARAA